MGWKIVCSFWKINQVFQLLCYTENQSSNLCTRAFKTGYGEDKLFSGYRMENILYFLLFTFNLFQWLVGWCAWVRLKTLWMGSTLWVGSPCFSHQPHSILSPPLHRLFISLFRYQSEAPAANEWERVCQKMSEEEWSGRGKPGLVNELGVRLKARSLYSPVSHGGAPVSRSSPISDPHRAGAISIGRQGGLLGHQMSWGLHIPQN